MTALLARPLDVDDDLTQRRFVTGTALAALLAGCCCSGSGDPTPSAGASGGFPRVVVHEQGTTDIPTQPRRVYRRPRLTLEQVSLTK